MTRFSEAGKYIGEPDAPWLRCDKAAAALSPSEPIPSLWMNFFKDKFSRPKKLSTSESVSSELGARSSLPYFTTVESPHHHAGGRAGQQLGIRPFPPSLSTGSFTPFQSQTNTEIKTFPRSATTHTFNPAGGRASTRPNLPLNGSITSSSQSSDESEEGARVGSSGRVPRRRPGGYRSTSLPRHSSAANYRRSVTMPNIQQQSTTKSQDDAAVGDNKRRLVGDSERRMEDNKGSGGGQRSVILNQIESQGRAGQGSPQLTSWLQSLADVPEWGGGKDGGGGGGGGGAIRGSKSEILRISRGRLKEDQASAHQLDNKRKRNSSRENSLESLLEEEDQTSEDCTSRDSLPYLDEEDPENRGPAFRPQQNQKNSLESLLEDQSGLSASKHKTNSLPKSSFSNIQLRVQEIKDQLEVLKQSSSSSGSKALQQVFPRIRPPNLVSSEFADNDNFEEKSKGVDPLAAYSTPVNPANPIYNLNSSLSCSSRPGFLNNRPLSMPSPPLANSPGNLSPNSLSPRSLSPNGNSPKHNIRPSACYSHPPNPQHQPSERGKRSRGGVEARCGETGLPNPFTEFGPSPVSSPSTLSPCSSNSLPSSQAGSQGFFSKKGPSWWIMRRNANSLRIPLNFFIKLFSYCFSKRILRASI